MPIMSRGLIGGENCDKIGMMDDRERYSSLEGANMASETDIPREWLEEFEAASRRPLPVRFRYSFIKTYKPVLDDARFRAFDTMEDYRRWCEENLPDWLGYGRI
jgi:hypothetical protein